MAKGQTSWVLLRRLSSPLSELIPNHRLPPPSQSSTSTASQYSSVHRCLLPEALQAAPDLNLPRLPSDTCCPCSIRPRDLLLHPSQLQSTFVLGIIQQIFDLTQRTNPKWRKSKRVFFFNTQRTRFPHHPLCPECTLNTAETNSPRS